MLEWDWLLSRPSPFRKTLDEANSEDVDARTRLVIINRHVSGVLDRVHEDANARTGLAAFLT